MCYLHIKPVVEDKINRFKMASLMELIIVKEQVLIHPQSTPQDDTLNRELNADFAIGAALSMISCMISGADQEIVTDTVNCEVNLRIENILKDHSVWLKTKPVKGMPVFINAQFYELIEMVNGIPLQVHG
jgi:hypothetical protein